VSTALICVEGVLGESSALNGFYPLPDGVKLAHALQMGYRLVLGTTRSDVDAVEHWLLVNGITRPAFYSELLYRQSKWTDLSDASLGAEFALELRRIGFDLGLVVSADPGMILLVTELGVPALLFTNPSYRWAEYRPDKKRLPRPWEEIDEEVVRQKELRAKDPRLTDIEQVERI